MGDEQQGGAVTLGHLVDALETLCEVGVANAQDFIQDQKVGCYDGGGRRT